VQKKLSGYYASNLKAHAPDTVKMKNGVYASLFHMVSTDADPHHKYCPQGKTPWCFFQRARANHQRARKHVPTMKREVAEKLLPLYERLTSPDLLLRCARMKTQNQNKCFNAQVWRRIPKTDPTSLNTVKCGVSLALLEFNLGPVGFTKVLGDLGVAPGHHQRKQINNATQKRLKHAQDSMSHKAVKKRKLKKMNKAQQDDAELAQEGVLYKAGAF